MPKVLDYVKWRGDLDFSTVPVTDVDEYIIACVGKPDYAGIVPERGGSLSLREAFDAYYDRSGGGSLGLIASALTVPVLKEASACPRYSSLRLSGYVRRVMPEITEQFSAITVDVPSVCRYVCYRGTDDSLTGWKENCGFAFLEQVPAQQDALEYLISAASGTDLPLKICGHSKGGNLAIYAAVNAPSEVQDRILAVSSYDGPGFLPAFLAKEEYLRIKDRIFTTVPEKSIVGMLLEHAGSMKVVKAETFGVKGHDGMSWETGPAGFVQDDDLSIFSRVFRDSMANTLGGMNAYERREFTDSVFDVLGGTGAENLTDFSDLSLSRALSITGDLRRDPEVRAFFRSMLENLFRHSVRAVRDSDVLELFPTREPENEAENQKEE